MDQEGRYTQKELWDARYSQQAPKKLKRTRLNDIFDQYLQPDPEKTVLEVGCGGGRILCWLAKTFRFKPFGIDYSEAGIRATRELFRFNDLEQPTLFQEDFFHWKCDRKFDVVCSFGFVEHFEDLRSVLELHADRVAPGGTLIFTMPHMAHLNYCIHWLVNREALSNHNTKIMNLRSIRSCLAPLPFDILHLDYHGTFAMPLLKPDPKTWEKIVHTIVYRTGRRIRKTVGRNRPNFLLSPHIVCVARRQEDAV